MKRAVILLLAAVLLLAGCKRSAVAQNVGPALDEWQAEGQEQEKNEPSDIVTLQNNDFSAELGFVVEGLPVGDGLSANKFFAIDGWFAQIEFERSGEGVLVLRVARTTSRPLRSTYSENHSAQRLDREIDGIEVVVGASSKGCAMIAWQRGDFQYSVHTPKDVGLPADAEIEALVGGLSAKEA